MSLVNVEPVEPLLPAYKEPDLAGIQAAICTFDGVQTCHVFRHGGRDHVVVHGGRLAKIAMFLDDRLGAQTYDLTYTCD